MMFDRSNNVLSQHRFSTCITDQQKYQTNGEFKRVKKRLEDPMSHRIIEKRRRDRMNNCLADLSRLIPTEYLKKGRGRIEKTEIIEMAIKHMKYLQSITSSATNNIESVLSYTVEPCFGNGKLHSIDGTAVENSFMNGAESSSINDMSQQDRYRVGYEECLAETMRFLIEFQGFFPTDTLYVKLISHLQKYHQKLIEGHIGDIQMQNISDSTVNTNNLEIYQSNYRNDILEMEGNVTTTIASDRNINLNLREMLVRPQLNSSYELAAGGDVTSHLSPEPAALQHDCSSDNSSTNGSLYKFKKYIRERFEKYDKSHVPSMAVYGRKRTSESIDSINSPSLLEHSYRNVGRQVPIFALHSKGSYYVPLTIDSHSLTPFMTDSTYDYDVQEYSSSSLHPVTISVNFNRRSSIQSSTSSSLLSANVNGLTQNGEHGELVLIT